MDYKIESNIEIPNQLSGRVKYPFSEMKVGDSFLVENCTRTQQSSINAAAHSWGSRHKGEKFSGRRIGEDVRVWRIK